MLLWNHHRVPLSNGLIFRHQNCTDYTDMRHKITYFSANLCDQHRENWGDPLVLSYRAANTENWRAFVMLPTQSTGVFSLRLSYCETNKDNWRAFLGFLTYTILRPTQKTGMPFYISSIVRTTQNTDFFIRVYIIVRSTQKTGGPFFRMIFILLCYQHKVLTFFCIWDYIIVRPTQKTGVPFWFWFIVLCDQRTKLACILRVRWNWHVIAWKMIVIFHILSWRPTAIWRFDNAQWQLFLSLPTKQNTDMWAIYNWCVDNVRG